MKEGPGIWVECDCPPEKICICFMMRLGRAAKPCLPTCPQLTDPLRLCVCRTEAPPCE